VTAHSIGALRYSPVWLAIIAGAGIAVAFIGWFAQRRTSAG
jgi:hypothetical protein